MMATAITRSSLMYVRHAALMHLVILLAEALFEALAILTKNNTARATARKKCTALISTKSQHKFCK